MTVLDAHVRGDTFVRDFTLGNGWRIADFDELWFTLRKRHAAPDAADDEDAIAQGTLTGGEIVADDDIANLATVTIAASLTVDWPARVLVFDLQGRRASASEEAEDIIETIDRGTIEILGDVTRAV